MGKNKEILKFWKYKKGTKAFKRYGVSKKVSLKSELFYEISTIRDLIETKLSKILERLDII